MHSPDANYDVLVIGAGLAGLQCTRLLAGHGLRVGLVDRKQSLVEAVHTTGIFVRRSLEDFALPTAHLGPAIRHVSIHSPGRRVLDMESDRDEFRIGRMGPLYERMLKDCRAAGADWLPATTFQESTPTPGGSLVRLRENGEERSASARFVIGADGTNSRVARSLALSENRRWIVGIEEVFEGTIGSGPRLHVFFDRRVAPGYIAWIADDGTSLHVGVGGYPSKFQPAAALEQFRRSLAELVRWDALRLVERRGGRIPVGSVLPNIVNERGLLLGDAAGAVSPLTAGGLDPCLRLSELAAKTAYQFLASGDPGQLSAYDGRQFRRRFRARRALRAVYDLAGTNLMLELGCAVLRSPPGRKLAQKIFFGHGSFPDVTKLAPRGGWAKLAGGTTR